MRSSVHVVAPGCILSHRLHGEQTPVSLETPRSELHIDWQGNGTDNEHSKSSAISLVIA